MGFRLHVVYHVSVVSNWHYVARTCNTAYTLMHLSCSETAWLCISEKVTSSIVFADFASQTASLTWLNGLGRECLWSDAWVVPHISEYVNISQVCGHRNHRCLKNAMSAKCLSLVIVTIGLAGYWFKYVIFQCVVLLKYKEQDNPFPAV